MRDFKTLIETLKEYLANGEEKKIYDKDVATALEISPARFATIKRRNSTPYESLIIFCKKEKLCSNELFFD